MGVPVVVVTDSSSRLPASLTDAYSIAQVPLHVSSKDGSEYLEGVDDVPSEVISTAGSTTSGASLMDLRRVYEEALERSGGDGVVAVHMSRRLSGTWSAARLAADAVGSDVRVVDSRSVGISLGLTTMAAAQAAEAGASRGEVYEATVRAAATAESMLCVQNLDNLRNSGRLSLTGRLLGSALSIKPILHMSDGLLTLRERHRTMTKALAKMIDAAVELVDDDPVTIGIQHCESPDLAADVLESLLDRLDDVTSTVTVDLGPVLGTHVGPGAVGVALGFGLKPLD